jgi:glycine/D-amino acid oxidase-like deaminating enzyme
MTRTLLGRQAVVIGAGMGGLTAARALADHFEHVIVLERDALPSQATHRAETPQGRHVHVLLGGGGRPSVVIRECWLSGQSAARHCPSPRCLHAHSRRGEGTG